MKQVSELAEGQKRQIAELRSMLTKAEQGMMHAHKTHVQLQER